MNVYGILSGNSIVSYSSAMSREGGSVYTVSLCRGDCIVSGAVDWWLCWKTFVSEWYSSSCDMPVKYDLACGTGANQDGGQ
jgi:hypothetical protein